MTVFCLRLFSTSQILAEEGSAETQSYFLSCSPDRGIDRARYERLRIMRVPGARAEFGDMATAEPMLVQGAKQDLLQLTLCSSCHEYMDHP